MKHKPRIHVPEHLAAAKAPDQPKNDACCRCGSSEKLSMCLMSVVIMPVIGMQGASMKPGKCGRMVPLCPKCRRMTELQAANWLNSLERLPMLEPVKLGKLNPGLKQALKDVQRGAS